MPRNAVLRAPDFEMLFILFPSLSSSVSHFKDEGSFASPQPSIPSLGTLINGGSIAAVYCTQIESKQNAYQRHWTFSRSAPD